MDLEKIVITKYGKEGKDLKKELTGNLVKGGFFAFLPKCSSCNWMNCCTSWARDFAVGGSDATC